MNIITKFRRWISILALCLWTLPTLAQEDYTSRITNAAFQNGGTNGWTTYNVEGSISRYGETDFAQFYVDAPKRSTAGFDIYQDISGLPNGKYYLVAKMASSVTNGSAGAYVANNADHQFVSAIKKDNSAGAVESTTPQIVVFDGTLRVGLKNYKALDGGGLFVVDYVKLYRAGDATEQELAAAKEKALQPSLHDYLSFTSTGPCRIHLVHMQTNNRFDFQYSTDDCKTWTDYLIADQLHIGGLGATDDGYAKLTAEMKNRFIDISNGKRVYFRAKGRNGELSSGNDQTQANVEGAETYCRYQFMADGTGEIYASGNIMSMVDENCLMEEVPAVGFSRMFYYLKNLRTTPRLTGTYLQKWCYEDLFEGTSVTNKAEIYAPTGSRGDSWNSDMYTGLTAGARSEEEGNTWLRITNTQPYLSTIKLYNGDLYNIQYSYNGTDWHNTWSDSKLVDKGECPSCHGVGYFEEDCETCHGELIATCTHCDPNGMAECATCTGTGAIICNTCQGNGYLDCTTCGGDGLVNCSNCSHTGKVICKATDTRTYDGETYTGTCCGLNVKINGETVNGVVIGKNAKGNQTRYWQCEACGGKYDRPHQNVKNVENKGNGQVPCSNCSGTGNRTCSVINCKEGHLPCSNENCDDGMVGCNTCHGDKMVTCSTCHGTKKVDCGTCNKTGTKFTGCSSCGGKGIAYTIVGITKGDGRLKVNESTSVTILLGQSSESTAGKSNRVYFRTENADNSSASFSDINNMHFEISGGVYASGNIMSLIKKDNYTSLNKVPDYAFYHLFENCEFLQASPIMKAENLGTHCYEGMFKNCIGLWKSSELPATSLKEACYKEMFYGCSTLHQITSSFTSWDETHVDGDGVATGNNSTFNWVEGVHRNKADRFVNNNINKYVFDSHHIPCDDEVQWYTGNITYLTFKAISANGTKVTLLSGGTETPNAIKLCYKKSNETNWTDYVIGTEITLNLNQSVQFRAGYKNGPTAAKEYFIPYSNRTFSTSDKKYYRFKFDGGKVAASGNILSLLSYDCSNDEIPEYAFYRLFQREAGETAYLTSAPELPGTILKPYAYAIMFYRCAALEAAPVLPAKVINKSSYSYMFAESGIKLAPELPAEILAETCYLRMFKDCKNLTKAPELGATTLATSCYQEMFSGCIKLTKAPVLPVLSLKRSCYEKMFEKCYRLKEAPELPSESLAERCYFGMFANDTTITTSPVLPAISLRSACYSEMFSGCKNLVKITVAFEDWGTNNTTDWVKNVSKTGTFFCPEELHKEYGFSRIPYDNSSKWRVVTTPYICFMATKDGSTVQLKNNGGISGAVLQYSTSGNVEDWHPVILSDPIAMPKKGDIVLFRAKFEAAGLTKYPECENCGGVGKVTSQGQLVTCTTCSGTGEDRTKKPILVSGNTYSINSEFSTSATRFYQFVLNESGAAEVSGDAMSLINAEYVTKSKIFKNATEVPEYGFYGLFKDCASMSGGIDLSATNIGAHGCQSMFDGCRDLSQAPVFHITQDYTTSCFERMFAGCDSLTTIPILPAHNASPNCFKEMFKDCKSLNSACNLSSIYIGEGSTSCYEGMFEGCSSLTETATFMPEEKTGNLADRCYYAMYRGCTSLTTAHTMYQRDLKPSCYESMFENCTSLREMPEIFPAATKSDPISLQTACFRNMFKGCIELVSARTYITGAMAKNCFEGMFEDCSGLVDAPLLSQTNMAEYCYKRMFANCKHLTYAPELPAKTLVTGCYYEMFNGCSMLRYMDVSFGDSYWNKSQSKDQPSYTYHWVEGVAPSGIFMCPESLVELSMFDISHIPEGWATEDNGNYLCFTGLSKYNNYIQFVVHGTNANSVVLKWSTNKKDWTEYEMGTQSQGFQNSQKIYFKAAKRYNSFSTSADNYITVSRVVSDTDNSRTNNMCTVSGNVMSLIDPTMEATEVKDYCFYRLFSGLGLKLEGVDGLTLPATKVGDYAYADMFDGCTYIQDENHGAEVAPELPATEIGKYSYKNLFKDWKKLQEAPELPAETLQEGCYVNLFNGCKNMNKMHVSFTKWVNGATEGWVNGVSNSGEFYCYSDLLADAVDKWGDSSDNYAGVYGSARIPKNTSNRWIIFLDVKMKFDYNTNKLTLAGANRIYWSNDPELNDTNASEKGSVYSNYVDAEPFVNSVTRLDSLSYYAIAAPTNIPAGLAQSIQRELTIYAYPKYYGYCLVGDTTELREALYYGEKVSDKNYPVRIFVENAKDYILSNDVKNLIVGDYVSLIGQSVEGVNIIRNEADAAPLKINGNHAYLQDMTISNNAGYSFYNYGTSNVLNVAMPAGQKYRTSTTDHVIEPVWTTGKDWSGCAKVDYVIRNGGAFNVVIQDRAYKEDTLLLEMDDKYAMTNCNTFYLMDGVNSTFTVRRANNRGAFGPMFAFNKFQNVAIPTDGEGNEVAQYTLPTIQLNSKGYSSFYYEAPDFEPGKPHRLRAINASAFVAACEGIGEPVKLYHINDLDVIPSGTGVILFGHPNDIVTFYEDRDADVSAFDELLEPENNQLRGIVKDSKKYPEYNSMTNWVSEDGFDYWKPGVSNRFYGISGETFMKLSATGRMKEYKAFFDFGASSGAASYRMAFGKWSDFDITIPEREGNSTGIKTICQSENPVETNITYNILGQRTSALKGLLVKNGKVILQK